VVYFADVEGLPVRQIAQLTKSPVGTVMSRLHRGRCRLRRLLGKYAHKSGADHQGAADGNTRVSTARCRHRETQQR
jgi:RNA polymerase sigma-70 factor, ECF subfamily